MRSVQLQRKQDLWLHIRKTVWKSALSRMMIMPDLLTGSAMDRFRLLVILFLLTVRFWEDTRESPITRSDSKKVLELHLDIRCL